MQVPARGVEGFLAKPPPPSLRLALFYGPDEGLARERARRLEAHVVDDPKDPFRIAELSAADIRADPARLGDEAAAIAMLGGRRVVRVRQADHNLAKAVAAFLADPPGDALVIVEAGDIGKGALVKAVEDVGASAAAIACWPDEGQDLETVIVSTLKAAGLKVAPDALADLKARLGDDRRMTRTELDKLALYMGPDGARSGTVTAADVEAVIGVQAEADFSDVADACAGGDVAALDDALARALAQGESVQAIIRVALQHFQRLHLAAGLVAEGSSPDAALDKAFPRLIWKRKAAIGRQIRLWTEAAAWEAVSRLGAAEIETRQTHVPAEAAAGRTLLLIAAQARRLRGR